MAEPTREDIIEYYARTLILLNGLTSISLTASPACSEAMVDAVLALAPDLCKLDYVIGSSMRAYDEVKGLWHKIYCARLSELQVTYVLEDRQQQQDQAKVVLLFQESQRMQKFTLRVAERPCADNQVFLLMRAEEGAEFVSTFSKYTEAAACAELCLQRCRSTAGGEMVRHVVMWDLVGDDGEGRVVMEER
jgi:hypothetical protein